MLQRVAMFLALFGNALAAAGQSSSDSKQAADVAAKSASAPDGKVNSPVKPTKSQIDQMFQDRADIVKLKKLIQESPHAKGLVSDEALFKLASKVKTIITLDEFYETYVTKPKSKAKIVQWSGYTRKYVNQEQLEADMAKRVKVFGDDTVHVGGLSCASGFGAFERYAMEYREKFKWQNVAVGGMVTSAGLNAQWMESGWNDGLDFGIIIPQLYPNRDADDKEDTISRFLLQPNKNSEKTFTADLILRAAESATKEHEAFQILYQGGGVANKEAMAMIHAMAIEPKKYAHFRMELHTGWDVVDPGRLKKLKAAGASTVPPPLKPKGAEKTFNSVMQILQKSYRFPAKSPLSQDKIAEAALNADTKAAMDKRIQEAADWTAGHVQLLFPMQLAKLDCSRKGERGWGYFLRECEDCIAANACWD